MRRIDRLLEPGHLLGGALVSAMLDDHDTSIELQPGQRLGAYQIERELERGGMGIIYLAHRADGAYQQEVAIKWLPNLGTSGNIAEQFQHERQTLARLAHPHIARLLDGGHSEEGHPWFAMEYVQGQPIDKYVASARISLQDRIRLLITLIDTVQFAHSHLLVHRDIKPANVLVTEDGRPMLLDFGIASLLSEANARPSYTRGWASPEQRTGAAPNTASDIWQLGKLLQHVLQDLAAQKPLPPDVQAIIARAMHDSPAARYASAAAMSADLSSWLAYRPISARPPSLIRRLQLLALAHPWGTSASIVVALSFALVVGGFMWRLTQQRNMADHARVTAESVSTFLLEDLLSSADPLQMDVGSLSVADVIEQGVERAENRLHPLPEVAAQVQIGFGRTLANLGRFDTALRAFDLALTHLEFMHGADTLPVLRIALERERYVIGNPESHANEERLLALRQTVQEHYPDQQDFLFTADMQLARAALLQGNFSTCVARYDALQPLLYRATREERGGIAMNFSMCLSRLGQHEAALIQAQTAFETATSTFGAGHPFTLETGLSMANALTSAGRYDEAAQQLHDLIDPLSQRYGQQHPVTLNAMHDLGFYLSCAQKMEEGVHWLQLAANGRKKALGKNHTWTAMSLSVLGMALTQANKTDAALQALRQARAILDANTEVSPFIQMVLDQNEGDLALATDQPLAAQNAYDHAMALAHTLYPPGHSRLYEIQIGQGLAAQQQGNTQQARALLEEALSHDFPTCRIAQRQTAQQWLQQPPDQ